MTTPAIAALEASGVPFATVRTERAHSAEESAGLQGIELGALLRTIVVRRGEYDYVFVLVPGSRSIEEPAELHARMDPASTPSCPKIETSLQVVDHSFAAAVVRP